MTNGHFESTFLMADANLFRIFLLIACCALISAVRRVSFLDPEAKLRANLTSRYALYPRIQRRAPIHVGLAAQHGISLDARLEVFSLIAILNLKWTIEELKWDPKLYNGIQSIIMPAVFVWKPLIYLSNRVKMPKMLDTSEVSRGIVFISHEGVVEWRTRAVIFVHCAVHLRNFPFDHHECQIRLQNPPDAKQILYPLNIDSHLENANSEWHVKSTGVRSADFRLIFSFHFQRISSYYIIALVTPILVSSISTLLMFWLPPASSEKIILGSFATALQLVLTGHVIWIAPHNAGPVPIIILLLVVCLFFSCLSLITSASLLAFTWRRRVSPSRAYAVPVPRWFSRILCLPESPSSNVNVRYVVGESGPIVTMETPQDEHQRGNIPSWLLWCFLLDRVFFILFLAFYLFLFISLLR